MKKLFIILLALSFPATSFACDEEHPLDEPVEEVVISIWPEFSEAIPNPEGTDTVEEWIELYNPYNEDLQLDGLFVDDDEGGSSPYALSGSMPAQSYYLISVEDSKIALNNSTDAVRLLNSDKEEIWRVPYDGPKEGESYASFDGFYEWTQLPTPGAENVFQAELEEQEFEDGDLSEAIELSELFPNPEGPDQEEEWIEITNGGSEAVNLGNWEVDDGPGGSDPYVFSDETVIEPGETLILYRSESNIALNNSNESVKIEDFMGEVMDEISYEKSQEGLSYSKIQVEQMKSVQASTTPIGLKRNLSWEWTEPSPGAENPLWKEIQGHVQSVGENTAVLFDGLSEWNLSLPKSGVAALIFQENNEVLVQASLKDGIYSVMNSELIQNATEKAPKNMPYELILSACLLGFWGIYEFSKKRKKAIDF